MVGASTSRLIEISCFIGRYSRCPKNKSYSNIHVPIPPQAIYTFLTPHGKLYVANPNEFYVYYVSQRLHCSPVLPLGFARGKAERSRSLTSPFVSSGWSSRQSPQRGEPPHGAGSPMLPHKSILLLRALEL
jgi:hypothetical protein